MDIIAVGVVFVFSVPDFGFYCFLVRHLDDSEGVCSLSWLNLVCRAPPICPSEYIACPLLPKWVNCLQPQSCMNHISGFTCSHSHGAQPWGVQAGAGEGERSEGIFTVLAPSSNVTTGGWVSQLKLALPLEVAFPTQPFFPGSGNLPRDGNGPVMTSPGLLSYPVVLLHPAHTSINSLFIKPVSSFWFKWAICFLLGNWPMHLQTVVTGTRS